jgi:tetracycline 7-halogenase / FADH2 O2-dependent halogenase
MNTGLRSEYDIIMLGSGLPGSILAGMIARMGLKILVIEKGSHPRFAIGEAMLPQSTMWMDLLSERFDYPEIAEIISVENIHKNVSKNCGHKRSISFLYHEEGEVQDQKNKSHQVIAPETPFSSEAHLLRADVDHHMLKLAIKAGAEYVDQTNVVEFDCKENDVTVTTDEDQSFHGKLLLDGSGYMSPLAARFNLRRDPDEIRSTSRTIFAHVEGLKNYDQLEGVEQPSQRYGYHDGTIHHIFKGGWFWVIPFDNAPGSENKGASIGLSLDSSVYPLDESISAEDEFWSFVNKFPTVKDQFENLTLTRPWIRTGRLQYSSKQAAGPGWCLLSHAYGFMDAIMSRGMINSFESAYYICRSLEKAMAAGNFNLEHFEPLNAMQDAQLDITDRLVKTYYDSTQDFRLYNAWFNLWFGGKILGDLYFIGAVVKAKQGNFEFFDRCDQHVRADASAPYAPYLEELVGLVESTQAAVKSGELTIQEAADTVCNAVKKAEWLPHDTYHWGGPAGNCDFDGEVFRQMCIDWGQNSAPDYIREGVCNYTAPWIPNNVAAMEELNKIKAHQLIRKERLAEQGVIVPGMMDAAM